MANLENSRRRGSETKDRELRLFIDGRYVPSSEGRMFANVSPIDGHVINEVHEATRDDVDAAVTAAKRALSGPWGRMSLEERSHVLQSVADGIKVRFEDFLDAEISDTGKPVSTASHIDIPRGAANFSLFADILKHRGEEAFTMRTPTGDGAINYAVRKPKGVIAAVCPWNLPLLLMTWKVAPALACGNTVVVKPSELTPTTASMLGEVMNAAGVPPGVYNVVNGFGAASTGEFLTRHPLVDAISFTGETTTGEAIMTSAAKGVRNVSMELGGKNPSIVFADSDMDKVIAGTLRSVFANCGQVCLGTERIYVERKIFDQFIDRLRAVAQGIKVGLPRDPQATMGPLISREHREKVLSYYARAREAGATIVVGGGIPDLGKAYEQGAWIMPTVWTGLPEDSVVVREEIFGPCCHVAPFDTEEEAIALANDSPYGLAACVWTENVSRAHRVSAQINAGIVWVNSWFLRDLRTAFGGSKQSGIGREGGIHGLEFYTELSNICVQL